MSPRRRTAVDGRCFSSRRARRALGGSLLGGRLLLGGRGLGGSLLGGRLLLRGRLLLGGLLLAGAMGCSGTEAESAPEPALDCAPGRACGDPLACPGGACVQRIPLSTRAAGEGACAVVSCPESNPGCCSGAVATATGNLQQSYSTQLQMLEYVGSEPGVVRADFMFDAPDQQGWLTFQLGAELDLRKLELTAFHDGVSDRFLSVNTNQLDTGGCAFAFELSPRATAEGASAPREFGAEVDLQDDDFCYDGGHPGRASELAFAIFSLGPGPASLVITNLGLKAE